MVTFSHHAVNFGAKALLIHHIFGVKTLPIWCQIDTIQSGLVRKQDTFWCENEIFYFSWLVAKTLKLGANSRPMRQCPICPLTPVSAKYVTSHLTGYTHHQIIIKLQIRKGDLPLEVYQVCPQHQHNHSSWYQQHARYNIFWNEEVCSEDGGT